jgi:hypothetical protein
VLLAIVRRLRCGHRRARLLRALSEIQAHSAFAHLKDDAKIFRGNRMVGNFNGVFLEMTSLIEVERNCRKLAVLKQESDVTLRKTKRKDALFHALNRERLR